MEVIAYQLFNKSMGIFGAQSVLGLRFAELGYWGSGFVAHHPDIHQVPCG
jgi:hypothetical protein